MASISTFARNFAKGKNGQHSNYATFEKNFALFWLTPTHTPAGAPGPSRTKPRAGAPDRHTLTGYRSRGVLDSEGSARQSRASAGARRPTGEGFVQISTQDRTHANKQRNEHTHKKAHTSARPTNQPRTHQPATHTQPTNRLLMGESNFRKHGSWQVTTRR